MNHCQHYKCFVSASPVGICCHPILYKFAHVQPKKYHLKEHKPKAEVREAACATINECVDKIKDIFNNYSDANALHSSCILL